ncbi:hypothetical protein CM49_01000 [Paenibacillus sp. P1XP2]|nr:hypothetical protein CM49_01000 [Paenibacillus sp. P1XP2]
MPEHQQDFSKHQSLFQTHIETASPSESSHLWLKEMDITGHDLPYVREVLQQSFEDWRKETGALPFSQQSEWAVADHEALTHAARRRSMNCLPRIARTF